MPSWTSRAETQPSSGLGVLSTITVILLAPFVFAARTFDFDFAVDADDLFGERAGPVRDLARATAYLRLAVKFQLALLSSIALGVLTAGLVAALLCAVAEQLPLVLGALQLEEREKRRTRQARSRRAEPPVTVDDDGEVFLEEGCRRLVAHVPYP